MKKIFILVFTLCTYMFSDCQSNSSSMAGSNVIVPAPVSYVAASGSFSLKAGTPIIAKSGDLSDAVNMFVNHPLIKDLRLSKASSGSNGITISLIKEASLKPEGYKMNIAPGGIDIQANNPSGAFYALQSLLQLIPVHGKAPYSISSASITDYPRFGWRGLMLDVSRHFFVVDDVKKYMDAMAMYKFNTLHLHLTDDNGWRIEIKALPKLTSVGAWRAERFGTFGDRADVKEGEPATYGGFYTQEQIKDLVKYAAKLNISIVPEIDVPGHSMAILAAYPELSCTHEKVYVNPGTKFSEWYGNGKFKMLVDNTLNPANEQVYNYLDKIFTEVAALFPNPYIHMGGDECYHGYWENDPDCKALMAKENLKDAHEIQSYFVKRVEKIIKSKGKKLIGWDEILEGGLAPEATVMSWRGIQGGIDAAKLGHEVVMSPTTFAYIDYMQGDRSIEFPIYATLTLQKSYSFEPIPDGVEGKYILGGQANLWSEKIPTLRHAFYMTFPRALAIAESVWSPKEKKDWNSFTSRVENHFNLFDKLQWNTSRSLYDAIATTSKANSKLTATLKTEMPGTEIHYTIDNTFPDAYSPKYSAPVDIPEGDVTLRYVVTRGGKILGRTAAISRADLMARAK